MMHWEPTSPQCLLHPLRIERESDYCLFVTGLNYFFLLFLRWYSDTSTVFVFRVGMVMLILWLFVNLYLFYYDKRGEKKVFNMHMRITS